MSIQQRFELHDYIITCLFLLLCYLMGCLVDLVSIQQNNELRNENRAILQRLEELSMAHKILANDIKIKQENKKYSSLSYLHPAAFRNVGCGNCPFTNPTFGCIGPDQSFICPSNRPYYIGAGWYLSRDTVPFINNEKDKQALEIFFRNMDKVRNMIRDFIKNNYPNPEAAQVTLKDDFKFHLTYQYLNCQTKSNIKTITKNRKEIFENDENYKDILNEFGYNSIKEIIISFDKILCMNDHYNGDVTFDLFLDEKSQNLMKKLIERTERIETKQFGVKPYLSRVRDQQAFHFTIGTIYTKDADYNDLDSKGLMDKLNEEISDKFEAIPLLNYPQLDGSPHDFVMKQNTFQLNDRYTFKKKAIPVFSKKNEL